MAEQQTNEHGREWHAMMRSRPGKNEAIRRTIEANRTVYDTGRPSPGKVERRVKELEAALAQTQQNLHAIEHSTIWKSTKKLRQLIEAARNLKSHKRSPSKNPCKSTDTLTYQEWIDTQEPATMEQFLRQTAGCAPVTTSSIGLVLWTDETNSKIVAQQLAKILHQTPATCEILFISPEQPVTSAMEMRAFQPNLTIEPGGTFAATFSMALDRMTSAYLCFHHLADQLADPALQIVAAALANQPETDLLFADEDWIDSSGQRSRPFFKPDWDIELQRAQDLVGPFAFYRTANLRNLLDFQPTGPAWRYDLAGRVVAACQPERIQHLPAILCHRHAPPAADAMRRQAKMHLQRSGITANIQPLDGPEPWQRVIYALPQSAPLVSIIVPTRDHAELLQTCTSGVLSKTAYPKIELLIVDNGTEETNALALLESLSRDGRVKILRQPGPFNWSALNNAAAAAAQGEVMVLLNNDIAVLQPGWLDPLAALAIQPDVGAVGAKLLYEDGRVQHAGITTDLQGIPRHLFRYAKPDDAGPSGMMALTRSVWAVTGACLAIRRDVFFEVGGLNEALPVAYNDVDLCMRLTVQGYRILWTPNTVLGHHEHASRPPDHVGPRREQVQEELNRLTRDWGNLVLRDPFLNPNYELVDEHLAFRTRTRTA